MYKDQAKSAFCTASSHQALISAWCTNPKLDHYHDYKLHCHPNLLEETCIIIPHSTLLLRMPESLFKSFLPGLSPVTAGTHQCAGWRAQPQGQKSRLKTVKPITLERQKDHSKSVLVSTLGQFPSEALSHTHAEHSPTFQPQKYSGQNLGGLKKG